MSLVNNMLRDLDQRRRANSVSPATVSLTPVAEAGHRSVAWAQWVLVVITVAAVIALVLAYLRLQQLSSGSQSLNQPVVSAPVQPASVVSPPQAATAAVPAVTSPVVSEEPAPALLEPARPAAVEAEPPVAVASTQTVTPTIPAPVAPALQAPASEALSATAPAIPVESAPANVALATENVPPPAPTAGSAMVRNSAELTAAERDAMTVQTALSLYNANDIAGAFEYLERYLQGNRDAHLSRETYAKLLISLGGTARALQLVDEGLQIAPDQASYKKIKARLLLDAGDFAAAAVLLGYRAPDLGADTEYHDLLATALLASRNFQQATTVYTTLLRHDPGEGKWWYGLAAAYEGVGDGASALQAYQQALTSNNISLPLRQRSQRRVDELRR